MRKVIIAILILMSNAPLYAQEKVERVKKDTTYIIDNVIIEESFRHHLLTSSAPLFSIDQSEMIKRGVMDISDALHRLPGVIVRDYGGAGGMKTLSVRGFGAQHTGISYDGIVLSNNQGGAVDLSQFSLSNIKRLSLLSGDNDDIFLPARNYNSTSILNIETKEVDQDDDPHFMSQMKFGSFGLISPFFLYEHKINNRLAVSANAEYIHADNNYPFKLKNSRTIVHKHRVNSDIDQGRAELNISYRVGDVSKLKGKIYYYDSYRSLPGIVRYYTDVNKERLHDKNFFSQFQFFLAKNENLMFKIYGKIDWKSSDYKNKQKQDGVMDAKYLQREYYTAASCLFVPARHFALDYALDYSFANLSSSKNIFVSPYRHSIWQSLTGKYEEGKWIATAKVLHSTYLNGAKQGETAKNAWSITPSISLSYKCLKSEELYVRCSYKKIFRVPTFNENYYFHFGSINLKPEKTNQIDVGLSWVHAFKRKSHILLTVDSYLNHIEDKIISVPYNMFVWSNINMGKVRSVGCDLTFSYEHELKKNHIFNLSGNYNFLSTENRTNRQSPYFGNQIAYVPNHTVMLTASYENSLVNVSANMLGVSDKYATNEHYTGTKINGYVECGLSCYRDFNIRHSTLGIRLNIKNILNKQYEIVANYPMPGINTQLTINYKF